jgi:hypothetical protein
VFDRIFSNGVSMAKPSEKKPNAEILSSFNVDDVVKKLADAAAKGPGR